MEGFIKMLNDWKMESGGKGAGITFQNKKREDYFIQVFYDFSHNPNWRVVIHADGRVINEIQRIIRNNAISFAKNYIRTH